MNLFKRIFGTIWAVWAIIVFVVTMLLFMIPFAIINRMEDPKMTRLFIRYATAWMGVFLPAIGCPLTLRGRQHFKRGENYIVVCNHNSLMDVPVSSAALPNGHKTIAKMEFARMPVFGILYKMGSILVDRKSEKSRKDSFIKMKQVLAMGLHMCIYPEGTRNLTDQPLKSFHDGAFRLAADTGKMVMPALIFHTKTVMPVNSGFFLWPHRLEMHFLEPVSCQPGEGISQFRERVYKIMEGYYLSEPQLGE